MRRTSAIILIAILAVSAFTTLGVMAMASARPFMSWNTNRGIGPGNGMGMGMGLGRLGNANATGQQSYVRIDGQITNFGKENVTGTILAQSRTLIVNGTSTRQGAFASAILANTSTPLATIRAKQNFTYTFYTANLANASTASLNVTGYSFFLNGTWNVYQITTNYTVTTDGEGTVTSYSRNQNAVALATKAYGELKVASTGSNFTLSITGVNDLTGKVHVSRITSRMFNPFIVNNESTTATTVTKNDLASIVRSFGASPGWGNYDQRMDYNMHYKIDITDLATAAANINSD